MVCKEGATSHIPEGSTCLESSGPTSFCGWLNSGSLNLERFWEQIVKTVEQNTRMPPGADPAGSSQHSAQIQRSPKQGRCATVDEWSQLDVTGALTSGQRRACAASKPGSWQGVPASKVSNGRVCQASTLNDHSLVTYLSRYPAPETVPTACLQEIRLETKEHPRRVPYLGFLLGAAAPRRPHPWGVGGREETVPEMFQSSLLLLCSRRPHSQLH